MTEAEWLACADPQPMLEFLTGRASDRKLRLFTCGCCRNIWHLIDDARSKQAIELMEHVADRKAKKKQLRSFRNEFQNTWIESFIIRGEQFQHVAIAIKEAVKESSWHSARDASTYCAEALCCAVVTGSDISDMQLRRKRVAVRRAQRAKQACQLRDILGNPFRPKFNENYWSECNRGVTVRIAEAVYTDRAFDRLPILADALEEAGCTDTDILNHCRQPGEHVRGCWVVDLLLDNK